MCTRNIGEMVRIQDSGGAFPAPRPKRLFYPNEPRLDTFPIQHVQIDWKRLIAKREMVLDTVEAMPAYLLKPEILGLLDAEKHPTYRLILDLMWTTGGPHLRSLGPHAQSFCG